MNTNTDSIDFIASEVRSRIAEMYSKLTTADPMLPNHLAKIHESLQQYSELVHILSDEEIRQLVAGQKRHVGIELVKEASKAKSPKVPKTSLDDL